MQKNLTIRRENHQFIQSQDIALSSLVRHGLDWAMAEDRVDELPKRDISRRGIETKRTCIKIKPRHQNAVEQHNISLSRLADALVDQYKMTIHQQDSAETQKKVTLG